MRSEIFIGYTSACEYWNNADLFDISHISSPLRPTEATSFSALSIRSIKDNLPDIFSSPLHVLVGNAIQRRHSKNVVCHSVKHLPVHSFVKVAPGVYIARPELIFVQMASRFSFPQRVRFGFDLCSSYTQIDNDQGFRFREPICSKEKIADYLDRCGTLKGVRRARQAMPWITNGAASPMESILTILLCLPRHRGGFGLPLPLLNHRVELTPELKQKVRKQYLVCDLFWKQGICIEYDSNAFHTGTERISSDSLKRAALASLGIKTHTVTSLQIHSSDLLASIAQLVGSDLGKRNQRNMYDVTPATLALKRELLS